MQWNDTRLKPKTTDPVFLGFPLTIQTIMRMLASSPTRRTRPKLITNPKLVPYDGGSGEKFSGGRTTMHGVICKQNINRMI